MTRRTISFDDLPLFAGEGELAMALLGPDRAGAWKDVVPLYERRGFPKINPLMGGRYTPAVKRFFDYENGVVPLAPAAQDGEENPTSWNSQKHRA